MDILITSNEAWTDVWFSKHNYAYELSRQHRVFFINPPKTWRLKQFLKPQISSQEILPNLYVVDYDNYLPLRAKYLHHKNNQLVSKLIYQHLSQTWKLKQALLWAFDPTRLYDPQALGCKYSLFHCVDYYYFKYIGERELCSKVDLIFATSQAYLDNYQGFDKPKYVVPHGISLEEFQFDSEANPSDLPAGPFGLYVGSIDWRMDYDLMERMMQRYPEQIFVFIGPIKSLDNPAQKRLFIEGRYPNLLYLGVKHYKQLKYYNRAAKFGLFCINFNLHFSTVHQHKTLGYLAQGKPVFGMPFYEYQAQENLLYLAQNETELYAKMDRFFQTNEDPNLAQERQDYAQKYTFDQILNRAWQYLQQHFPNLS